MEVKPHAFLYLAVNGCD